MTLLVWVPNGFCIAVDIELNGFENYFIADISVQIYVMLSYQLEW